MLSLFLIVHYRVSFRLSQHKVVCKLLLTAVCGRSVLLLLIMIPMLSSLGFGFRLITSKRSSIFCTAFNLLALVDSRHTRVAIWPVAVCGLRHYPPLQTLMRGRKLQVPTAPAIGYIACCVLPFLSFFKQI